jgi:hypothetical protein
MTAQMPPRTRSYSPPDDSGIDCAEMRTIGDHARHLDYLMERALRFNERRIDDGEDADFEWSRVRQWLAMVAGLEYVDVVPITNAYWGICEGADDYDDAKNYLVSDVATEETRLHYAWGAVERLLRVLQLPVLADKQANRRLYNRATSLIATEFSSNCELAHYPHVARHLLAHTAADTGLRGDRALREASVERAWRPASTVLLPLGAAMRNIPAHGASEYGEPTEWGTREDARKLPEDAHAARLACRGLLLSIQQLLAISTEMDPSCDLEAEELGWPILNSASEWFPSTSPTAVQLLTTAHLAPPSQLI